MTQEGRSGAKQSAGTPLAPEEPHSWALQLFSPQPAQQHDLPQGSLPSGHSPATWPLPCHRRAATHAQLRAGQSHPG